MRRPRNRRRKNCHPRTNPSKEDRKTMRTKKQIQASLLLLVFACSPTVCRADMTLALNKTFVNKIKNKVTVVTNLNVDIHPNTPHAIKSSGDDGDIHMAGRDNV